MKKYLFILFITAFSFVTADGNAQCSICTKTAQQMGERPAKALNTGIVYLAILPLAIFGIIGYRWWKSER